MSNKSDITLRGVVDGDVPIFFEHQNEPGAADMAAFRTRDRAAFNAHWAKIRNDATVILRTILLDGEVVGHVASFNMMGKREVAYWIGRAHWGKGIATVALAGLLREEKTRPLYAHVAVDNMPSRRVLEKCGFAEVGTDRVEFRGQEIEELIVKLE